MNKTTVLVTGGAGYIGSNIVKILAEKGYSVVVVDNLSNSFPRYIKKLVRKFDKVKFYNFDLLNSNKLDSILKQENIEAVIHMAGCKYVKESFAKEEVYYLNNVTLTKQLLEAMEANKIKKLVFSSSITVYGNPTKGVIDEESECYPVSPYAKQKLACERLIRGWQEKTKADATILRLSNPIGANVQYKLGDDAAHKEFQGVLPYIISHITADEELVFNGGDHDTRDGTTVRDYIHVEDTAMAFVKALETSRKGLRIYNIGAGGNGVTVLEMLKQVEDSLHKEAKVSFGEKREGDVSVLISDNTKAKEELKLEIAKNLKDMVKSQISFEKYKAKYQGQTQKTDKQ